MRPKLHRRWFVAQLCFLTLLFSLSDIRIFLASSDLIVELSKISGMDLFYRPLKGCSCMFELSEAHTLPRAESFSFIQMNYDLKYAYNGTIY